AWRWGDRSDRRQQGGALPLHEKAAEDLARGGFGELLEGLHSAHLLVRRGLRRHEGHQVLRRCVVLYDDESLGDLSCVLIWRRGRPRYWSSSRPPARPRLPATPCT